MLFDTTRRNPERHWDVIRGRRSPQTQPGRTIHGGLAPRTYQFAWRPLLAFPSLYHTVQKKNSAGNVKELDSDSGEQAAVLDQDFRTQSRCSQLNNNDAKLGSIYHKFSTIKRASRSVNGDRVRLNLDYSLFHCCSILLTITKISSMETFSFLTIIILHLVFVCALNTTR